MLADTVVGRGVQRQKKSLVAKVHYLLRVNPLLATSNAPPIRVAVCTLFSEQPAVCKGELLVLKPSSTYANRRAVLLDDITGVLVSAHPSAGRQQSGPVGRVSRRFYDGNQGKLFFAKTGNVFKSK